MREDRMVWGTRRATRDELIELLGRDVVEWAENVARMYDELLPPDDSVKPDDRQAGHRCVICGDPTTVDGMHCVRHRDQRRQRGDEPPDDMLPFG